MESRATPFELLPVASARRTRAHLRRVLRGRWAALSAAVGVLALDSALPLAGPVATGRITQAVADHRGAGALVAPLLLLAVTTVAAAVTGWAAAVLLARVVQPVAGRLREDAVSAALALPVEAVEAGGTGDLVSRVSGDVERVSTAASGALGDFAAAAFTIAATLVGLAALDWRFALAGLLAVPVQVHTLRWYLRTARPVYAGGRTADGRRASALLAAFTALPTLRALRLGPGRRAHVEAASVEAMTYEFEATRAATRFYGRLNAAEFTGLGAILLVAYVLVHAGSAGIGAATTAALFFVGLFDPVNTMLGTFDSVQQAGAGLARIVGVATGATSPAAAVGAGPDTGPYTAPAAAGRPDADTGPDAGPETRPDTGPDTGRAAGPDIGPAAAGRAAPDAGPDTGPAAAPDTGPEAGPGAAPGAEPGMRPDTGPGTRPDTAPASDAPAVTDAALVVRDLRHRYRNGPEVLHGIALDAGAGQRLAVVGATGSGKSTLAALIAGLRSPHGGSVTWHGTPARELATPAPDGRRRIALVTQEQHLFLGTVADNLRLARRDASAAEIAAALATVGAAGWAAALPDGPDTIVGAGGTGLNPRQVQQIALARVLLMDPELVVLDEATAEAGSDAAQALDRAARAVTEGRTAVVVAHRLSQAADADVVVVMDDGRIVEQGRPDELRSAGGVYAGLWAAWERGRAGATA